MVAVRLRMRSVYFDTLAGHNGALLQLSADSRCIRKRNLSAMLIPSGLLLPASQVILIEGSAVYKEIIMESTNI